MFSSDFLSKGGSLIEYTLPKLHKNKGCWYIDFYAWDPLSNRLKRKKVMLNKFGAESSMEDMAALIIHNIVAKLQRGWSPWVNADASRHVTPIMEVFAKYKAYLKAAEKKEVLRKKTVYDYTSRLKVLQEYVEIHPIAYSYQLDSAYILDFLDFLLLDRDDSATTRNNYRTWLSSFGTWLLSRKYLPENPSANIKFLPEQVKFRQPLTPKDLQRLSDFLRSNNKVFLLACMFQYYTLIRPHELSHIRVRDISIERQTVFVSSLISKNRKDGLVALNDKIIRLMIELHTFDSDGSCYLFGKNLYPSHERMVYNKFRIEWSKVRSELKFPDHYQFYSLKDSGIRDLANSEGAVVARNQARHSDLSVTNRYAQDYSVNEVAKHFEGGL